MTFPIENIRLHLTFFDELKQVQILGARQRFNPGLCNLGFVTTKEALREVLEAAGIDHYIVCSGDIAPVSTFQATYYELSAKEIVETIEKGFHKASELELKILQGAELTEEEKSFGVPNTLWVYSSSTSAEDGLKTVYDWFQRATSGARPFLAAKA